MAVSCRHVALPCAMVVTVLVALLGIKRNLIFIDTRRRSAESAVRPTTGITSPVVLLGSIQDNGTSAETPLLTLFTTFKPSRSRHQIHLSTLRNWSLLPVHRVLYLEEGAESWEQVARAANWDVRVLSPSQLRQGVPVLKRMFLDIQSRADTPYIGYANADLLFDRSLDRTLSAVSLGGRSLERTLRAAALGDHRTQVVIGKRKNLFLGRHSVGRDLDSLTATGRERLSFHTTFAIDYLLISAAGFDWSRVPDLVVGRVGYDNWLVGKALQWGYDVIDASDSLLAVHLTGEDGIRSGFLNNPKQLNLNMDVLRASPDHDPRVLESGRTDCAPLRVLCRPGTSRTRDNHFACPLELTERRVNATECIIHIE